MNIIKHLEYFDPGTVKEPLHIIGCGAIGSTLAEGLVRTGFEKLHLYDFDTVVEHNLANQMFYHHQIGMPKVEAVDENLYNINPGIHTSIQLHPEGYWVDKPHRPLTGHVFLCVDNIDLRRTITEELMGNSNVKTVMDFRMALEDAQHYAADWSDMKSRQNLLKTMQFTHEEAAEATPRSACGTTLSVSPTVRCIVALGIANFIGFKREPSVPLKKFIQFSPFYELDDRFV